MADSPYIFDVTEATFGSDVIERSKTVPVLVDFWADWCQPCKNLMPILSKLAEEYAGGFVLAKVNADEQQMLAAQTGVRSLPTVILIKDGQVADHFMGALPENEVREFLDRHVEAAEAEPEAPLEANVETALALFEHGDVEGASEMLRAAQAEDPSNPSILLALGKVSMAQGDTETVESILKILPEESQNDPEATRLKGGLKFAQANNPEMDYHALLAKADANEADSEEQYQLAVKLVLRGDFEGAAQRLLTLMMKDRQYGDDGARQSLLALFDVMGDDPVVGKLRRRMFTLLH